jgi:predicted enzyme related to lactoylglutathione lyase
VIESTESIARLGRGERMERVTGIGGLFFRAKDPERLTAWYVDHLGVDPVPQSYETPPWWQQAGPTVFTAMSSDSGAFGGPDRQWSVNFRVPDLDAMVRQLRGAGIDVDVDPDTYPNGRFAMLKDPDGNVVQLWQPAGGDLREQT